MIGFLQRGPQTESIRGFTAPRTGALARRGHHAGTALLCLLLSCTWVAAVSAEPIQIPAPKHAKYRIAIHCSRKVLQLWRHTSLIREYPIHVGKGGLGKTRSGDHKTPIGDYEVSWMASSVSAKGFEIIEGKSWCKDNKFVYGSTGPALEKLWARPYGGNQATVISINYPNVKDELRGYTGECIHIHADRRHANGMLGKSYGCIHMFPQDAMELYELVNIGTPVKILP